MYMLDLYLKYTHIHVHVDQFCPLSCKNITLEELVSTTKKSRVVPPGYRNMTYIYINN